MFTAVLGEFCIKKILSLKPEVSLLRYALDQLSTSAEISHSSIHEHGDESTKKFLLKHSSSLDWVALHRHGNGLVSKVAIKQKIPANPSVLPSYLLPPAITL